MTTIAILLTCHNRLAETIRCLDSIYHNILPHNFSLDVYLVDDGSTDGTEQRVRELYPMVTILKGDGNLFWNRGMFKAFQYALDVGYDLYLWLNDDTILNNDGMLQMLDIATENEFEVIVVGTVCDPENECLTYGGGRLVSPSTRPFLYSLVVPNGHPQEVDVMNGNIVMIPSAVAKKVGNLDPRFEHGFGDIDYGMRARKSGFKILITRGYVGKCSRNSLKGTFKDKSLPLQSRLKNVFSRKGLPWRSWLLMCWRHGGWLWPLHFSWGYIKVIIGRT